MKNLLDDPELLQYLQESVYASLVDQFSSEDFLIEGVDVAYLSQEYLDEVAYNSRANVFFGYTLEELRQQFGETPYVLTVGDGGLTVAVPFEDYNDTYDQIIKNVATGTGVILVCVTISVATGGAGLTVASAVFSFAAQGAVSCALLGGAIDGAMAGVVTGIRTGDLGQGLKSAALGASEGFKVGAIVGAASGGAAEGMALARFVSCGLTVAEAVTIQRETKWPLVLIENIHSMDEYAIYKAAGLSCERIGGKWALTRKIDWTITDELGRTNIERVKRAGVKTTNRLKGQHSDIPTNWYVVEETNFDGIVIWQSSDGAVYQAGPSMAAIKIAESLLEYIA